jgi:hypothetical protein
VREGRKGRSASWRRVQARGTHPRPDPSHHFPLSLPPSLPPSLPLSLPPSLPHVNWVIRGSPCTSNASIMGPSPQTKSTSSRGKPQACNSRKHCSMTRATLLSPLNTT